MLPSLKFTCQITSDQRQVEWGSGRLPQDLPESGKVFPFTLTRVRGNRGRFGYRSHLTYTDN